MIASMNSSFSRWRSGFTLVEMIVAISILALVAVLGWRGLDSIVRTRVALTAELEQTRGMQLTFAQLQNDCRQIAPAMLLGKRPSVLATPDRLLMVRLVLADQQPTRLQVVVYRLQDGVLMRQEALPTRDLAALDATWQAAFGNSVSNIRAVPLQSDIALMQVRLWASDGQNWQQAGTTPVSTGVQEPSGKDIGTWSGLEVTLQMRGHDGKIVKTFLLGGA